MIQLSVIVPVYNVEPYLKRCVESILKQDYYDFELLLIDDGSPDGCGKICDDFEKKDKRVRVIHQENKGLAETRNIGIQNALGKYISFIDSDDYIVEGTYSHSMNILKDYQADIVCFQHMDVYDNRYIYRLVEKEEKIKVFNAEEAYDALFYPNYINVITCNKIIRKSLLTDITFPSGKLYEDMFTTYKYISKAKKIVSTDKKFYIYCHREGSIGTQKYSPTAKDLERAAKETYLNGKKMYPKAKNLDVGYLFWAIVVANMMIRGNRIEKSYVKQIQKFGRSKVVSIIKNPYFNFVRKSELLLFTFSQPIYKYFYFKMLSRRRVYLDNQEN